MAKDNTKKLEVQAKIEKSEVVAETGGYHNIRFTKVKYKKANHSHIDIRRFQRAEDDDGEEVFFPTKMGFQITENEFMKVIGEFILMPKDFLHPVIYKECSSLMSKGEYDSAVIKAFKLIEIDIRKKIRPKQDEVGVALIRKAFHHQTGKLSNPRLPVAEREALAHYIAGVFGLYRNAHTHRKVDLNFITAFDKIAVASDIMKIVETSKVRRVR